jgi:hypothetical protein
LLRQVAAERGPDGSGYCAVIVVAHSLGAVIAAELFWYLNREVRHGGGDPGLARFGFGPLHAPPSGPQDPKIPIYLFTMGNPLRQLLNRFFPHRYRWVREEPDNGLVPLAQVPGRNEILPKARPTPADLGIEAWLNAYCSGDYVGRGLWLDEWYTRTKGSDARGHFPEPVHLANSGSASEMCIGVGAHTHYWDSTAPDVALAIDRLVQRAKARVDQPVACPVET